MIPLDFCFHFSGSCIYAQLFPRLIALHKEKSSGHDKVNNFSMLLKKACLVLTPTQKKALPTPIKEKVQKRTEMMEEKKLL